MDSHSFLQGIFLTQGLNSGLLYCRQIFYHLSHQASEKDGLLLCQAKGDTPDLCLEKLCISTPENLMKVFITFIKDGVSDRIRVCAGSQVASLLSSPFNLVSGDFLAAPPSIRPLEPMKGHKGCSLAFLHHFFEAVS